MTDDQRWRDWQTRGVPGLIASISPVSDEVGITPEEIEELKSTVRPDPDRLIRDLGDAVQSVIKESKQTRTQLARKKKLRKIDEAMARTADLREYYAVHLDAELVILKEIKDPAALAVIPHAVRAGALLARIRDLVHEPVASVGTAQLKHAKQGGQRRHRAQDLEDQKIYDIFKEVQPEHKTKEAAVLATIDRTGYKRSKIFKVISKFEKKI